MLLSGALARPSASASTSTCLRCQLRDVLLRAGALRTTTPHEPFSTRPRALQDADSADAYRDRYRWTHLHPHGRIVGKAGRRQRVVTEKLSRKSLEEDSSVIVLRDVEGDRPSPSRASLPPSTAAPASSRHQPLTAKEIEHAVNENYIDKICQTPEEAEVHASILECRPQNSVVNEDQFDRLVQTLSQSYTIQQLSRYFGASLHASTGTIVRGNALRQNIQDLVTSQWRPGRSELTRRHESLTRRSVQSSGMTKKTRIIERILRLVWNVTVASQQQEVGELEMDLHPWQLRMLFDLSHQDRPYYESLMQSKLLIKSTTVEQYQPDGIVRIAGRRQDAEEVAANLRLALMGVQRLVLDLKRISPLMERSGRNPASPLTFTDRDLRYVSNLTNSVIAPEQDNVIAIYNKDNTGSNHARRLLLSMLDLSVSTHDGYVPSPNVSLDGKDLDVAMIPSEPSSTGLHRALAGIDHRRLCQIIQKAADATKTSAATPTPNAARLNDMAHLLAVQLDAIDTQVVDERTYQSHDTSYWGREIRLVPSQWNAEFCKLLHDENSASAPSNGAAKIEAPAMATQYRIPGVDTLLSYAEVGLLPRALQLNEPSASPRFVGQGHKPMIDWRMPYLMAHFIPSPAGNLSSARLPQLTMRFTFTEPSAHNGKRELVLDGVKADVEDQSLSVSLPGEAVDVRFTRGVSMVAIPEVKQNRDIRNFVTQVNESVHTGDGVLSAPPNIIFHLPHWLVEGREGYDSNVHKDVPVNYLFERFEQVQRMEFAVTQGARSARVDDEMRAIAESLPRHYRFDYREIEGGAIYGNTTRLALRRKAKRGPSASKGEGITDALSVLYTTPAPAPTPMANTAETTAEDANDSEQLTQAALRIAHLLTRANAGTLLPLRASQIKS